MTFDVAAEEMVERSLPRLHSASVGGRVLAWREAGVDVATPLVLLHGIGSNARVWAGQFAAFASERRVVAWNAPGYAGSDPLPEDWPTAAAYADALAVLLDHLGIRRCVLVGQSLGAVMATAFAIRMSHRVAALVLASPASGYRVAPGDPLPEGVAARIADARALGPAGLADARYGRLLTEHAGAQAHALVRRAMAEIVLDGYAQAARLLAAADLPYAVTKLTVPTTVMWGEEDVVTPPAACRAVAEAVPGGRTVALLRGGHAFATEVPELFNEVLRPILAAADAHERVAA